MKPSCESRDLPNIGVIGAGPCGLAIAKNLREHGLTRFVVFEKNDQLGGNWLFDDKNTHSSIYETTHIISSKRLSQYEDFPMPADYPDYPSHRQLLRYFNQYADHFGLKPFIRFNTQVVRVSRCTTGQWQVISQDAMGEHEELFDHLLVANGHHWDPLMPDYPGAFTGSLLHSHQYKKASLFQDKRVLVVGGGNSACDIAVEIARISPKTCISIRSGQHIFPKFIFGKPIDVAFAKLHWMPFWCKQHVTQVIMRLWQGRYAKYQLKKPSTKPLETHPIINSELLYFIRHGKVLPRDGIERFDGERVVFVDGRIEAFDTVIFATGYQLSFPFFSPSFTQDSLRSCGSLYLKMIHPQLENLYFIGLFQPQGCIWPLADYQAKIAAGIISGTLPRATNVPSKIKKELKKSQNRFKSNPHQSLEVDYSVFRKQLLRELQQSIKY